MECGYDPHEPATRLRRRLIDAGLVAGLILALGPIWGLVYTVWQVLAVAAGQSADPVTLGEVKRVTLTLKPTIVGLCVAPVGILISTMCILALSAVRRNKEIAPVSGT